MTNPQTLLVELVTEELPPKALKSLGQSFAQSIFKGLQAAGVCDGQSQYAEFASPRRLAVRISNVLSQAADESLRIKLLPVAIGLDAKGEPTAPLIKKLAGFNLVLGENLALENLQREDDGKQQVLFVQTTKHRGKPSRGSAAGRRRGHCKPTYSKGYALRHEWAGGEVRKACPSACCNARQPGFAN